MNIKLSSRVCGLIFVVAGTMVHASDIVDRIVATVNGQAVLQSDWDDAVLYEAFIGKRPLNAVNASQRKAALDHLIDQELLREQMRAPDSVQPTEQEVENQIADIRKQYDGPKTDAAWSALLARYRLTEAGLRNRLTLQLELSRLVDIRLRPSANITSRSIESYYQHELLPQLHQSGAEDVPLAEVSPKIKELLTQQKVNELLITWLQELRAGSQIHSQLYSSSSESRAQ